MRPVPQRFFSDFYDSVFQRAYHLANPASRRSAYIGRLRFDSLLSERVVLTDAQLLDGAFFTDADIDTLLSRIRRTDDLSAPLIVKCRATTLEASLIGMAGGGRDGEKLKAFNFSSIGDDTSRHRVLVNMTNIDAARVTTLGSLSEALLTAELNVEEVERLSQHWARLDEAARHQRFAIEPFKGRIDFKESLGSSDPIMHALEGSDACFHHIREIWRLDDRNKAMDYLTNQWRPADEDEWNAHDFVTAKVNAAYNRALAGQHECLRNYETIHARLLEGDYTAQHLRETATGRNDIEAAVSLHGLDDLPEDFVIRLGELEEQKYRSLFHKREADFHQWWREADFDALRRAMEPFARETVKYFAPGNLYADAMKRTNIPRSARYGIAASALAMGIALPESAILMLTGGAVAAAGRSVTRFIVIKKASDLEVDHRMQRIIEIARRRVRPK